MQGPVWGWWAESSLPDYPRPQFQEEADSVSQTLAKLNSSLDTQYSPAPGGPPGAPTELLQQLEVSEPHQTTCTPLQGMGLALASRSHPSPGTYSRPEPTLGGEEKGVCSSRKGLVCYQQALSTSGPQFPHLQCDRDRLGGICARPPQPLL